MQLLQADEIQIVYAIRYKGGNEWDIFRLFCHDFAGFNILQNILQDFRRELLDFKDMEAHAIQNVISQSLYRTAGKNAASVKFCDEVADLIAKSPGIAGRHELKRKSLAFCPARGGFFIKDNLLYGV